jgi:hypothetical protein
MADVEQLLRDYIREHRAGGDADPLAYLERVEGTDRRELEVLIDEYLVRAPRQRFDPEDYERSRAPALVSQIERAFEGESGTWPALLPRLRMSARLKRKELVKRLAEALGVPDRVDKVERYYNAMEHGTLPAPGVSDRVLAALGAIVGESGESLRAAGRALSPGAPPAAPASAVFARRAPWEADAEAAAAQSVDRLASAEPWDEVDALFRGG